MRRGGCGRVREVNRMMRQEGRQARVGTESMGSRLRPISRDRRHDRYEQQYP